MKRTVDLDVVASQEASFDYASFMEREYEQGLRSDSLHQESHRLYMRIAFVKWMMRTIEQTKASDPTLLLIGPGDSPCGHEFSELEIEVFLRDYFKKIVIVDYSTKAFESVNASFAKFKIEDKVTYQTRDITDGLGRIYDVFVKNIFTGAQTLSDLLPMSASLPSRLDAFISESKDHCDFPLDALYHECVSIQEVDHRLGAIVDPSSKYEFHVEEKSIDITHVYLPLVLAGTGAASEGCIWDKYRELRLQEGERISESTRNLCIDVVENIHAMIRHYNYLVAYNFVGKLLRNNPLASVLATVDVDTFYLDKGAFRDHKWIHCRFDVPALFNALRTDGIDCGMPSPRWEWHDDIEHHHCVNQLKFCRRE